MKLYSEFLNEPSYPFMASKIFETLKKHGLITIPDGTPDDKIKLIESDFEAIETSFKAQVQPQPKPKADETPATATSEQIADAVQRVIDEKLKPLQDSLTNVTAFTKQQQDAAQSAEKSAQEKRYKDHVEKLATEGRITKAKKDELLKPESIEANVKVLDTFITLTNDYPVQPALAPKQTPASNDKAPTPAATKHEEKKRLEDAALAELQASMN